MAAKPLDEVGAADDDPGLRAAEQLVAAEADEVGAACERLRGGRLVTELDERARAEVVEQRYLETPRDRRDLFQGRPFREADDAEVRLVHPEDQCRTRAVVVGGARAVRGPHLDEPRTGARSTSGMRKPSPISISSPRETSTSRSSASARARAASRPRCC
jgi:hypothetical protein